MTLWKSVGIAVATAGVIGLGPITQAQPATSQVEVQQPAAQAKKGPVTLTLKKDSVIGIRLDDAISSETAVVEQKITAKVSRDVIVDGRTVIAAGTKLEGMVEKVEKSTPNSGRSKITIRFNALVRPDNTRLAISTDTISRELDNGIGPGATFDSGTSAFGAVVGVGTSRTPPPQRSGSPTPTVARPVDVRLPAGALLTVRLNSPLSITIDRDPE